MSNSKRKGRDFSPFGGPFPRTRRRIRLRVNFMGITTCDFFLQFIGLDLKLILNLTTKEHRKALKDAQMNLDLSLEYFGTTPYYLELGRIIAPLFNLSWPPTPELATKGDSLLLLQLATQNFDEEKKKGGKYEITIGTEVRTFDGVFQGHHLVDMVYFENDDILV